MIYIENLSEFLSASFQYLISDMVVTMTIVRYARTIVILSQPWHICYLIYLSYDIGIVGLIMFYYIHLTETKALYNGCLICFINYLLSNKVHAETVKAIFPCIPTLLVQQYNDRQISLLLDGHLYVREIKCGISAEISSPCIL